MTALKHVNEVNVVLAETEWVQNPDPLAGTVTPPLMTISDPQK